MADEKTVRAFLAVDLPREIKDEIGAVQERLKQDLEGIRWTRPEGIHLTLKFFGDIQPSRIDEIADVVAGRTTDVAPLSFSLGPMGAFPHLERPRVLWIGLDGDIKRLATLQRALEKDLDGVGFKSEKRSFTPHLTLGRARSSRGIIIGFREKIAERRVVSGGTFTASGLTLFRSELKPGGAVYTRLRDFSFDAPVMGG